MFEVARELGRDLDAPAARNLEMVIPDEHLAPWRRHREARLVGDRRNAAVHGRDVRWLERPASGGLGVCEAVQRRERNLRRG